MNTLELSWKSTRAAPLTVLLNVILVSFGTGILTLLLLAVDQLDRRLKSNAKEIDAVVGAKGSPLQLVLSSMYYVDFPTGNIPEHEAMQLARNPMVKSVVPLALGDNYQGFRIVGTNNAFRELYELNVARGRFPSSDLEVVAGAGVASTLKLNTGSTFFGGHGLTDSQEQHRARSYIVTGILKENGDVTDQLILTSIPTVRLIHQAAVHDASVPEPEITALLVKYRNPMAVMAFPRMVNQTTSMQAVSPAREVARLSMLIGVGADVLSGLAMLLMVLSGVSVFISLYNSLKEHRYDLAVMRSMGASRLVLLTLVLCEALWLTLPGSLLGIGLAHAGMEVIGNAQQPGQETASGGVFLMEELWVVGGALAVGMLAAILPAVSAYRISISKVLSAR